jgi:hypothetical protein
MIHHQNTLVMFQVSLLTTGIHHLNAHHFEYFWGVNASHVTSALAKMATVMPTSHAPSHQQEVRLLSAVQYMTSLVWFKTKCDWIKSYENEAHRPRKDL